MTAEHRQPQDNARFRRRANVAGWALAALVPASFIGAGAHNIDQGHYDLHYGQAAQLSAEAEDSVSEPPPVPEYVLDEAKRVVDVYVHSNNGSYMPDNVADAERTLNENGVRKSKVIQEEFRNGAFARASYDRSRMGQGAALLGIGSGLSAAGAGLLIARNFRRVQ